MLWDCITDHSPQQQHWDPLPRWQSLHSRSMTQSVTETRETEIWSVRWAYMWFRKTATSGAKYALWTREDHNEGFLGTLFSLPCPPRTPLTHWAALTAQACVFWGPQSREHKVGTWEGGEVLTGCSGAGWVIIKLENLIWLFLLQGFRTRTGLYPSQARLTAWLTIHTALNPRPRTAQESSQQPSSQPPEQPSSQI